MFRRMLLAGSALALLQTGGAAFAASTANSVVQQDEIGEVVVTARRRAEQIRDVPGSVAALTPEQIETLPLERVEDFLRQTPAATMIFGGPDYLKDVSIRGQGGGRNGFSASATGIYRNGIYLAGGGFGGKSLNRLDLFDLGSFEVYRGPQGALYGRNAVGGAINLLPRTPSGQKNARLDVGYDDRERISYEGFLNLPLTSRAAVRLGVTGFEQDGGFIRDEVSGRVVDTQSFFGARGAIRLDLTDNFSTTLTLETSESEAPPFATLGQRFFTPARPAATFDPSPYVRRNSRYGPVEISERTAFWTLSGRLGFAELDVVAARREREGERSNEDVDKFLGFQNIGATDLAARQAEDFTKDAFEARLTSLPTSPLKWMLGVDWQSSTSDLILDTRGTTLVAALRETSTRTDLAYEKYKSFSIFGSADLRLTDRLTVSGEARWQRDDSDFVFTRIDREPTPVNSGFGPLPASTDFSRLLPGLSVKYETGERSHVYARVASAYRPAGYNAGVSLPSALTYRPETSVGGEVGWKGNLTPNIYFGVAAYYQTIDDAQAVTTVSPTDTTFILQNVAGVDYWGAELEFRGRWRTGGGRTTLVGSLATQDGQFKDGAQILSGGVVYDLSGKRANRVRDVIASLTFTYDWETSGGYRWFYSATVSGEGGGYENATGALKVPGQSRQANGYHLVGLRAGFRSDTWSASVFVTNLFDKVYSVQEIQQNAYYNEGRVIGVRLARDFSW